VIPVMAMIVGQHLKLLGLECDCFATNPDLAGE
jgi:hypothetical protein